MAITWKALAFSSDVMANTLLTTRGDLIRRGASAPERLALGASGYVLTSDGTDAAWAASAGGASAYTMAFAAAHG